MTSQDEVIRAPKSESDQLLQQNRQPLDKNKYGLRLAIEAENKYNIVDDKGDFVKNFTKRCNVHFPTSTTNSNLSR
jgi:hypothetical protein